MTDILLLACLSRNLDSCLFDLIRRISSCGNTTICVDQTDMGGTTYQARPVTSKTSSSKMGYQQPLGVGSRSYVTKSGPRAREARARVARCKTWRMVDDPKEPSPSSEGESILKPRGEGDGLTSFLPGELELETTTSGGLQSTPTDMTNHFSFLDSTNCDYSLDKPTTRENHDIANEDTMTFLKSPGRNRLKYKEPPTTLALASSVAPNPDTQPSPLHSPASDHDSNPKPSGDSAVEMGVKNKPHGRKKQQHQPLPGDGLQRSPISQP